MTEFEKSILKLMQQLITEVKHLTAEVKGLNDKLEEVMLSDKSGKFSYIGVTGQIDIREN